MTENAYNCHYSMNIINVVGNVFIWNVCQQVEFTNRRLLFLLAGLFELISVSVFLTIRPLGQHQSKTEIKVMKDFCNVGLRFNITE